ncbi:MAG TPA: Ada metal-binding domain-containing protein [Anaerohalosphaeraceae bacterium]|nr:hypothetical protein [Phycisphaerae bacterium]HOK95203.1 Ada metal-binding domain-containing protein [Anaerohalosphaeraceae bacterium]HOL31971.1 Ada metal-binding domain-containing protein [Anaerohalosphaeraceae bacterium]HOM75307.1 Ada metal-binding domain-containing protein [Anaerohalosphaeraceae bacterium]HPO69937.1 Ada metal-binding domain-containing protein [Anaerohalosphaeraceae bacterium]
MKTVGLACAVVLTSGVLWADPETYGDVSVSALLRIDETVTLFCDIADFPPVIGQNMPVQIRGLKTAASGQDNLPLLAFLNTFFFSGSVQHTLVLRNIQRGQQFCLVADIEVDGQDLCQLLVEKKLAQRIIEIPSAAGSRPDAAGASAGLQNPPSASQPSPAGYIATKTSKVFHRADCPHIKRLDASKTVVFPTRQNAAASGRRPCKTCNP